jgi:catechol 2,3-dioxygenase-like lactoylglutathione lyase family enzyme
MPLISRIDTIFVPAADTAAAAEWYARIFGMVEVFRSGAHIGLRIEGAAANSTALTLIPAQDTEPSDHVAFNFFAPDIQALHGALLADGREVTPINPLNDMRWFDFVDIAGNRVNVCHFPES